MTRSTITVGVLALLMARASAAQSTGTIAGTVTDATATPLAGVRVTLYNEVGGFAPTDFTDSLGRFSVPNLAPGTYYAQASLEPEYPLVPYGSTCNPLCYPVGGTPIVVQASLQTTISISLTRAGRISGTLTNADTGAAEFGSVTAFDSSGFWVTYNNTNPLGGTYEITGLRPGRYFLRASNSIGDVNLSELYNGIVCDSSCDVTQGTPVDVVSGQTTFGIDFALDLGGSITGVVTSAASGLPLNRIAVFALNRSTGRSEFVETGADGSYRIPRLESGTYSVWAQSFFASYANQVYGGHPYYCDSGFQDCTAMTRMSAPVAVVAGSTTPDINFALAMGAELRGSIRDDQGPLNGARIVLYARDGWIVLSRTLTGSTFALTGLPAGRYFLVAGRSPTHANAGYPARDCGLSGCQPALSDPIDVVAGQVVTGLEIRLRRFTGTASIAGRIVTSEAGAGIAGVATVCAIECVSVQSDNAGQFTVSGLGAGTYYVRASSFVGNRVSTWYGGTPVTGGANRGSPIVLGNGVAVTGVEARLALGAEVRGRVTLPGFSPSPFVRVFIHNDQGVLLEEVSLSSSTPGTYAFTRLPQGTYYLRADGVDSYVVDEVYGGAPCLLAGCVLAGTPVTLAAGEVRDGIDFSLEVGGWIIGRARGRKDLGDRIVHLDLYNTAGALVMSTYGDTRFRIQGVPAGTYYLKATIGGRKVVYDDVPCQPECTPTAGTPIVVQAARATSGIEIVIDEGTSISGVIRDAGTGLPLSGVIVSLLDDSGAVVNGGATDLNGLYELRDVGPGRYFARTFNRIGYVDEQYDDRLCSSCEGLAGTPIDVPGPTPVAGIDFRLVRGGWVSGRVTDMHGAPIAGAGVTVYDEAGVRLQRALTAADGSYVATVPAGMVFVQSDPLAGYQVVTYPNVVCSTAVCSPLAGTAVAIVAGAQTEDINLVLPIVNVLTMTPVFLAGGVAGRAYSATIQVTDGAAPVQFSIVSGGLPPGMSLDVDQGLARARLSGTPASAGVFTFALRAIDSGGRFTQRLFSLTVAACALSLSQEEVSFPISGGSATVRVGGGCSWQATTSSAWVSLTSAETDVTVTASINAGSARTANVSIGSRVVVVRQAGPESAAPFGIVDIPIDGSTAVGSIAVGGWALDDLGIVRVTVYRDSVPPELPNQLVYLGDAVRVRGARPDVEMLYPNLPFRDRAGWGFLLLTNMLPNQGNGTFRLHAFAEDVEGKGVLLGSKTIVAANATATVPFGAIDTPGQGETISGSSYVNFGWALTPLPKTIPLNGSTITVFLDGAPAGNVDYNHFRPDIASLFPGLNNTNGAVGFRILDTTQLANGIHTISWVVSDNAGSIEGIGSRYFHVDNAGLAAAMTQSSGIYSVDAPDSVHPGPHRRMRIVEMERLTIDLAEVFGAAACGAPFTAYEVVGHERRPLPAGSSLDPATGRFAWQPGPGFIGTYRLVFAAPSCDGPAATVPIDVRIVRAAR